MKQKITPDKQKAKALKNLAENTLARLESTNKLDYPTNTLNDYYFILHQLMEAITSIKGIKIKGERAYFELIDYISKNYNFSESERTFMQELRDFRNKISYEGLAVKKEYIQRNEEKIYRIINRLKKEILSGLN